MIFGCELDDMMSLRAGDDNDALSVVAIQEWKSARTNSSIY